MIRKYHNHKLQTTPWHREEEPLNHHKPEITFSNYEFAAVEYIRKQSGEKIQATEKQ